MDVYCQKPNVTSHIQRYVYETKQINFIKFNSI